MAQSTHRGRSAFEREMEETARYYQEKSPQVLHRFLAPYHADGMAIRYIQERFFTECRRLGMETIYVHPEFMSEVGFLRRIAHTRPDGLLFINRSPGEYTFPRILSRFRLPRVIWCIDDPHCFIRDPFGEQDFVWTWDDSYQAHLVERGARSVDPFPYVADLDEVEPIPNDRFRSPVSYIGQVKRFDPSELGLDEAQAELVRFVAQQKEAQPLRSYESLVCEYQAQFGLQIIHSNAEPLPRFLRYGIYILANARRRMTLLEKAMPFGLKIYGNDDWLDVLGDHPLRACFQGSADPQRDVPSIFVSSQINLNIHSLQAASSLNQRDFNCPLVGGFLLTDWIPGADQFFIPGEEMIFYSQADELPRLLDHYLQHEDERCVVIRRGQARVRRDHTYGVRVPRALESLAQRIRERYG